MSIVTGCQHHIVRDAAVSRHVQCLVLWCCRVDATIQIALPWRHPYFFEGQNWYRKERKRPKTPVPMFNTYAEDYGTFLSIGRSTEYRSGK